MVVVASGWPWKRPKRWADRSSSGEVRKMTDKVRRVDALGPMSFARAEFVRALRQLLGQDPWDGPLSAA